MLPKTSFETLELIRIALREDRVTEDITTRLTNSNEQQATATIIGKDQGIFCGADLVKAIVKEASSDLLVQVLVRDGERIKRGSELIRLTGLVQEILALERTILNFLQRLSGIATNTAEMVRLAGRIELLDTRKTTPGWRSLEKYAVAVGGGESHRTDLHQMAVVKNNHIDANGGDIRQTLQQLYVKKPPYLAVQIEVRNLEELKIALEFAPNSIMLDNFSDSGIGKVVKFWAKSERAGIRMPLLEISGNVTRERMAKLRALGVPRVSTSALVNGARNLDLSLRIDLGKPKGKNRRK
jgi:nicotinate-nucleotide pyrophosphorylase (carboxylating)